MRTGDRRFVHLTRRPGLLSDRAHDEAASTASDAVGCVVTIFGARDLSFGRLAVGGLVGPRCRVSDPRHEQLTRQAPAPVLPMRGTAPPATLLHVRPTLLEDGDDDEARDATRELHRECVDQLLHPACAPLIDAVGLVPPLLCAERLSLFLCGLLLHPEDVDNRLASVHSTSTRDRLSFCRDAMSGASWWEPLLPGSETADGEAATAGQGSVRPWELPPPDPEAGKEAMQ